MRSTTWQPLLLTPFSQEDVGELQIHLPALKIVSFKGPGHTGGVVSSLAPLVRQLGTTINWIALSSIPENNGNGATPGFTFDSPQVPSYMLQQSNEITYGYLWTLLHGFADKAHFDLEAWKAFRQLTGLLAEKCLRQANRSFPTLIWLHDFETCLLAPFMAMEAGVIVSSFFHIPWPAPEKIIDSPVAVEIVEAMLANKLLGFHTLQYADNFLNTVKALLPNAEIDFAARQIKYRRNVTQISAMPLGIDFQFWQRQAKLSSVEAEAISARYRLAQQIILGVDRFDFNKGILEKLNGLSKFLSNHPEWLRRFHYVQIAQKQEYANKLTLDYQLLVEKKVEEINNQFRVDDWEPIVWKKTTLSAQELAAWYQAADIIAVAPLSDGLNLVCKEYVATRSDEQGVVILSKEAGSAAELSNGAILVNPQSADEIAAAFVQALTMDAEEKHRRMVAMRDIVGWNKLHDWACGLLRQSIKTASASDLISVS